MGIISLTVSKMPEGAKMTFGYYRIEVLATLLSILLVWCFAGILTYCSISRMVEPVAIDGLIIVFTTLATFLFTVALEIFILIRKDGEEHETPPPSMHDLFSRDREGFSLSDLIVNCVGDLVKCVFMAIVGITVYFAPEFVIIDSLAALTFTLLILSNTVPVLKDALSIILEASPPDLDAEKIIQDLRRIEGVHDVHAVHLWRISSDKTVFSCHIRSDNPAETTRKASQIIKYRHKITFPTI
jgi:cation diffusion facilitator family transporter